MRSKPPFFTPSPTKHGAILFFAPLFLSLTTPRRVQNGSAPTHGAAGFGDLEVLKTLLAAGANVHATNDVSGAG
jgi:ankyrin repeat protein